MMTENYILKLTSNDNGDFHYLLKYDNNGLLVSCEIRDQLPKLDANQITWMWNFIPKTIAAIEAVKSPMIKIRKVETDLSFKAFWDRYDMKAGSRKRAEGLWNKLDDTTRALAMQKVTE